MQSFEHIKQRYEIDKQATTHYLLCNSYTKDASLPIVFKHYYHDHKLSSKINYKIERDYCSLYIFLTGKFSFVFDNTVHNPSYGDVIFIRDGEKASSCFYQNTFVDYYEINFPKCFFDTIYKDNPFYSPFYDRNYGENNMLTLSQNKCETMFRYLKNIENLIDSESEHVDLLSYSYIIRIMEVLYSQFQKNNNLMPGYKIPSKLKDAIDYIHRNYNTILSVEEIASHCYITHTYLSRMFKKFLLCTPNEYITSLRISQAKYLLDKGDSVTDACFKAGFNSYSYFIAKFKSVAGITPLQYKKNISKNK